MPYASQVSTHRGRGKVWLAGSAAHTALSAVGFSLNAGLAEARALGTGLASAIRGETATTDIGRMADDFALEARAFLEPRGRYVVEDGGDPWIRAHASHLSLAFQRGVRSMTRSPRRSGCELRARERLYRIPYRRRGPVRSGAER